VRDIRDTEIHGVGRSQGFSMFEQTLFIESNGSEMLNQFDFEFYVSARIKLYIEMTEGRFQWQHLHAQGVGQNNGNTEKPRKRR
jgi:hypothetical protein